WMLEPLASLRGRWRQPEWRGQDLRGKRIVLRPEQGLGDAIQFLRYAAPIKALGATVILQSWSGLAGVAEHVPGIDIVVPEGEILPPFDYWAVLMSVPAVFGTEPETIPATVPYLTVDPDLAGKWKARFASHSCALNVGLVWAGSAANPIDRGRSIPFSELLPLLSVEGAVFYSLQKGERE